MIPILIFLKLKGTPHIFKMQLYKDILFFDTRTDDDVIGRAVVLTLVEVVELSEAILLWLTFACVADDIVTESEVTLILVTLVEFYEAKWPTPIHVSDGRAFCASCLRDDWPGLRYGFVKFL